MTATMPRHDIQRTDAELWARWSELDRKLEDIEPCFHREYRYQFGNDCAWCDTHAEMNDLERAMDRNARE